MSRKPSYDTRLLSTSERLAIAGYSLENAPIADKLNKLEQATDEVKNIIQVGLPSEILDYLYVVDYSDTQMTIAVNSITARNHIHYVRQSFIELLNKHSNTFRQLKTLKVIVVHLPNKTY